MNAIPEAFFKTLKFHFLPFELSLHLFILDAFHATYYNSSLHLLFCKLYHELMKTNLIKTKLENHVETAFSPWLNINTPKGTHLQKCVREVCTSVSRILCELFITTVINMFA